MKSLQSQRERIGFSQRQLAGAAGLSFRTIQLLEWGKGDPRVSTLQKVASSLGYPSRALQRHLAIFFQTPPDSIAVISEKILEKGGMEWKGELFNFVDRFREDPRRERIESSPAPGLSPKIRALLASTVESLCVAAKAAIPEWCDAVPPLADPWFVSGMESLKASALAESPVFFRKRNIFVLENFLERA